ncbi:MAG: HD domain-containing protein [Candidatus Hermodarchaeota archaeon]
MNWSEYKTKLLEKRNDLELTQIKKAFLFAMEKHKTQKRKGNGEPYITHPIAVSLMLTAYSEEIICAALLHDVLEDTDTSVKEIEQNFGSKILSLVQGVTKLPKSQFPSKIERDRKSWEKFEKDVQKEPNIILIKLADRIHNLRTIEALAPDRRLLKLHETLDRMLPLAKQLNLGKEFWSELEEQVQKELKKVKNSS